MEEEKEEKKDPLERVKNSPLNDFLEPVKIIKVEDTLEYVT